MEKTELTSPQFTGLRLKAPLNAAGGIKAVTSAMRHVLEEMGPQGFIDLFMMNQKGGFDCSGCAWPDPDTKRSGMGEYCENGAKALAEEATLKRVDEVFFSRHSVSALGQWSDFALGKSGRITRPFILKEGQTHYQPIEWQEAFDLIAGNLNGLSSPDEAIFYTSGRTSNEAAFLYQLLVRRFGTNNLPDCSNMCHESSGKGLSETLGIGKGSVTLEDLHEAELIIVVGQNPGTNHPRMLTALQTCKQNGGKIIAVNPLKEAGLVRFQHPQRPTDMLGAGTSLADLYLQVQVNGDIALMKAIMLLLWEKEQAQAGTIFDHDFIQKNTEGYERLIANLANQDLDVLIAASGIARAEVEAAAEMIASRKRIIICWAMGLTQHKNGVENIREMVNLLLLKGSIGKKGAGTCPVRGHSNVQGDRTMGIWEAPPEAFLDRLQAAFGFEPPRHHGYDTVHAIKAMHAGKASVFFAMGGNFLSATPDTEYTAQALRNCQLTVQISTKLNRSHLVHGKTALILPCLVRSEKDLQQSGPQFVSVENSMGIVHSSEGKKVPASPHLLSETAIVCRLAQALWPDGDLPWKTYEENYDHIRTAISKVIPGTADYNQRVRRPEGFYLPNCAREGKFNTPIGKARFTVNAVPDISLAEGTYRLFTIRSHDQYNTTIYGLHDRYRGIYNERRVIMMNESDMAEASLSKGSVVNLIGEYQGQTRRADRFIAIPYSVPKGCVAAYFPETNVLVPIDSYADRSHTPTSKSIIIRIESSGEKVSI